MAISVRKRGKVWHARGTVRIGRESVTISEYSTGETGRAAAIEAGEREAARIRQEHLDGPAGRARRLTVADCLAHYETTNKRVGGYDLTRLQVLNATMGHRPLAEAGAGWQDWLAAHPNAAPSSVQRWRSILVAALKTGCEAHDLPTPRLPTVQMPRDERLVYLSPGERIALLRAYTPYAACPVLLLAYQGLRTQEALRLDWRTVDLARETIHIPAAQAKSGRGRTVPMHPRVRMLLTGMHNAAGRPDTGTVFLSSRGQPYQDTRLTGGNPLKKAHARACRMAGVTGFRVHDWRHDWAARCAMSGMDLVTLMRLGGWASLSMVQRYASVTAEHMRDALQKIA